LICSKEEKRFAKELLIQNLGFVIRNCSALAVFWSRFHHWATETTEFCSCFSPW